MPDSTDLISQILDQLTEINFFVIILIVVGAWLMVRVVETVIDWLIVQVPDRLRFYLLPLTPIVKLVIVITAGLAIVQRLFGGTRENFLAAIVALSIGMGFAFQEYFSSVIAGIVAIYERPYRRGDWIEVDGAYGEVTNLGFRALQIVTPDDTTVTIPNKKLWDSPIYNNNSGQQEHLCVANFYLHPDHDAARVQKKLYEVALTSPYLQLKRPIAVVVLEKPWGTHYRLKAYPIDGRDEFKFITDMTIRGKLSLSKLGVEHVVAPAAVVA